MSSLVIDNPLVSVWEGEALETLRGLEAESVDTCITSPPYWGLRDYGMSEQIGLEVSPFAYIEKLTAVFEEVRRVLKPSGTLWVVIGDSYAGSGKGRVKDGSHYTVAADGPSVKQGTNKGAVNGIIPAAWSSGEGIKAKDLCGIPWRLAFRLQELGWYLRQDIIWAKPNPMPESVTDRCTRSHEYIFLLSKSPSYYYDSNAIAEDITLPIRKSQNKNYRHGVNGRTTDSTSTDYREELIRNKRDVWLIANEGYSEAHFATYPTKLVELCILAGSPAGGLVLDPFGGCGTTAEVAVKLGRRATLIELNPEYVEMIRHNLGLFAIAGATA